MTLTPASLNLFLTAFTTPHCLSEDLLSAHEQEILDEFIIQGILEMDEKSGGVISTKKGLAFMKMILSTPYPTLAFINPLTNMIVN